MRARLIWTAMLVLTAGCDERYGGISLRQAGGDLEARVSEDEIRLMAGRVVVFRVEAHATDGHKDYDAIDEIELRSDNSSVAELQPGVKVDTWTVVGRSPGRTDLEVWINDKHEDYVPVVVEWNEEEG